MSSLKKQKRPKAMRYTEEQKTKVIEQLWVTSAKKLYNFLGRFNMSTEEREDVVQEAFAKAYKSLGSFKGEARLETWLFKIAKNIWLNKIRYNHMQKRDYAAFDIKQYFELQGYSTQASRVTDPLVQEDLAKIVEATIVGRFKSRPEWIEVMREIFINYTDMSHDELAEAYGVNKRSMRREKYQLSRRIEEKLRALKAI